MWKNPIKVCMYMCNVGICMNEWISKRSIKGMAIYIASYKSIKRGWVKRTLCYINMYTYKYSNLYTGLTLWNEKGTTGIVWKRRRNIEWKRYMDEYAHSWSSRLNSLLIFALFVTREYYKWGFLSKFQNKKLFDRFSGKWERFVFVIIIPNEIFC